MTFPATQIPFDLSHRSAHGREDFLIAPENQDAINWIDRWPEWPAPCLIIYGPIASGKSHLAAVWRDMTEAAFIQTSQLSESNADQLAATGRNLVIDNADLWFGDRQVETTLFHLYNIMREEQRFLLMTANMAPAHASFAVPDLASRLRAAPAAAILPPDDTLLSAVLVKLFSDRQLVIGADVLHYTLPRMERSFAAAHALVAAADRLALAEKRPISIPLIRRVLMKRQDINS